jgi:hypothetical protein
MARWRKGEEQVASLIEQRHLQQVAADSQTAAALLASAGRHVESARRTVNADPEAAYTLAYDAAGQSLTPHFRIPHVTFLGRNLLFNL